MVRLALPRLPVEGGDQLDCLLQAACGEAAESEKGELQAVNLADLLDGG